MKKLLCLFLLLWLPLFSAAAAAMDLQMQAMQTTPMAAQADAMPCHNEAAAAETTAQPCCGDHQSSHSCLACGVCAFSHAGSHLTAIAAPALPHPVSAAPGYLDRVFSSQLYPPLLKPPIST